MNKSTREMISHAQATEFVRAFPLRACAFTTLTGLDEQVDMDEVVSVSNDHLGRVEWGVLLGDQADNSGRYPSLARIEALADIRSVVPELRLALHMCGRFALRWVDGDQEMIDLASRFDRIQLNVSGNDSRLDRDALLAALHEGRHPAVITQYNRSNIHLTEFLGSAPNHALLFDASGGRGIEPDEWPLPIDGKVCGYAGGLGPGTINANLRHIASIANGPFWIDMESSLRAPDDTLNLSICRQALKEVDRWRRSLIADISTLVQKHQSQG